MAVKLQPRGRRDELLGFADDVLRARVSAPPADGKANRALCKLIADRAGVAPSRVTVVRGAKSREKLVEARGVAAAALPRLLAG